MALHHTHTDIIVKLKYKYLWKFIGLEYRLEQNLKGLDKKRFKLLMKLIDTAEIYKIFDAEELIDQTLKNVLSYFDSKAKRFRIDDDIEVIAHCILNYHKNCTDENKNWNGCIESCYLYLHKHSDFGHQKKTAISTAIAYEFGFISHKGVKIKPSAGYNSTKDLWDVGKSATNSIEIMLKRKAQK